MDQLRVDPQVEAVRGFADDVAERIATLGGSPKGTPGTIVAQRSWDDYSIAGFRNDTAVTRWLIVAEESPQDCDAAEWGSRRASRTSRASRRSPASERMR